MELHGQSCGRRFAVLTSPAAAEPYAVIRLALAYYAEVLFVLTHGAGGRASAQRLISTVDESLALGLSKDSLLMRLARRCTADQCDFDHRPLVRLRVSENGHATL